MSDEKLMLISVLLDRSAKRYRRSHYRWLLSQTQLVGKSQNLVAISARDERL